MIHLVSPVIPNGIRKGIQNLLQHYVVSQLAQPFGQLNDRVAYLVRITIP